VSAKVLEQIDFDGMKVEFVGVFAVVYMGGWASNNYFMGTNDFLSVAAVHLFAYSLFIWTSFKISGGLLNPALTIVLMFYNRIKLYQGLFYIASQLVGSLFAVSLLKVISPEEISSGRTSGSFMLGYPSPRSDFISGFYEIFGTFIIVLVYYTVAIANKDANYHLQGIAMGAAYATNYLIYGRHGGSANIARMFGCFCLSNKYWSLLLASAGSIAGAILAGFLCEKVILRELILNPIQIDEPIYHDRADTAEIQVDGGTPKNEEEDIHMHL